MTNVSPRLRKALMQQRMEMFAEAEVDYLEWECEALQLLAPSESPNLTKAAIRSTWISWGGELPAKWRECLPEEVSQRVTSLMNGIANERGRAPWATDSLLERTICVIQRRSLLHIYPRNASKVLCRLDALAQQGVQQ